MAVAWADLEAAVEEIAADWRAARPERQARRHLEADDFARLRDAGLLRTVVPEAMGGLWRSVPETTPRVCALLRTLGRADPSVALVSAMHPSVVGFWLAPAFDDAAWVEQRDRGRREPRSRAASGGRSPPSPAAAATSPAPRRRPCPTPRRRDASRARPTSSRGDKHFGSGSGIADHMITTALPEGEDEPAIFVLDTRDRPWDGSSGLTLLAPWDGIGMAATQSHAMRLERCPATRMAWDGPITAVTLAAAPLVANLFTAVVLGVLDEAVETARAQLAARRRRCAPTSRSSGPGPRWTTGSPSRPSRARSGRWPRATRPRALHADAACQAERRRAGRGDARPGWLVSSAAARSRAGRRSAPGSRTCGPSASCGRRGDSPTTGCSPRPSAELRRFRTVTAYAGFEPQNAARDSPAARLRPCPAGRR